jgi:outer membrane protein assembly factor BamB
MIKKVVGILICMLFIGASFIQSISGNYIENVTQDQTVLYDDADWWPMFHHDLGHNGYSTSYAPDTNIIRWYYITDGWVHSSPAVADGKIYFGSFDKNVYCLDAIKGDIIWKYTTGGYVSSSPAVADGKVYIGSYDYNVYCLDSDTGNLIWRFDTGSFVYSSPAVADGKVYIGSGDYENQGRGRLYCLDAMTGDVIWSFLTGSFSTRDSYVYSSPAVADGKVYFGSCDMNMYCLDAGTGDKIWNYLTGDWIMSSPAVADGKVYIGSNDKKIYCFGNQQPNKPNITGLNIGKPGIEYEYKFMSSDPDGDNVKYCINWGDDNTEVWIGPYPSDAEASAKHIWSEKGNYVIKVKVRDVYGAESDWATLEVTMPKNKINSIDTFFLRLLENFPILYQLLQRF